MPDPKNRLTWQATCKVYPAISDLQAIEEVIVETEEVESVITDTYIDIYTVPAGKILCMERVVAYPVMINNSGVMVYIKIGADYYWLDGAVASVINNYTFFPLTQKVDAGATVGVRFIVSAAGHTWNAWLYGYLIDKY